MSAPPDILLEAQDLGCHRGGRPVFAGLDLSLASGRALLIKGPNGSGKTSLLRLVAGLLPPTAGRIFWRGRTADEDLREDLHFAGHALALKSGLSVAANLAFWARFLGGAADRIPGALNAFGLTALADFPVRALSAGQQKRASLARLLLAPRPLWLLDEPTAAIDAASEQRLYRVLDRHLDDGGMAMIATHLPLALDVPVLDMEAFRPPRDAEVADDAS